MNTKHKIINSALTALAAGSAMIAAPAAAGAHSPQRWDICPAADTEPACEIVRPPHQSVTDGSRVAHLPAANGTAEQIDIPDYNCDEWRNPVIACPGLDSTAEQIDIPDYNCDEWRNPVIACPGLDSTAEQIDIPDYNCDEWRNPVIACPG